MGLWKKEISGDYVEVLAPGALVSKWAKEDSAYRGPGTCYTPVMF